MNMYAYIFIAAFVTFAIRVIPLTLIREPIKNRFARSFLFYVPYITLATMTFPAIIYATNYIAAGIVALVVGIILSWKRVSMFIVSLSCCATVIIVEFVISLIK